MILHFSSLLIFFPIHFLYICFGWKKSVRKTQIIWFISKKA